MDKNRHEWVLSGQGVLVLRSPRVVYEIRIFLGLHAKFQTLFIPAVCDQCTDQGIGAVGKVRRPNELSVKSIVNC